MFRMMPKLVSKLSNQRYVQVKMPTTEFSRELHSTIQFDPNAIPYTESPKYPLFRGDPIKENGISLPVAIFGLPGRNFPKVITSKDIVKSKDDILIYRFLSLTQDKALAKNFAAGGFFGNSSGRKKSENPAGVVIEIDTTLMQGTLIDAERTYEQQVGRPHAAKEYEVNALVVLSPSIKSFTLDGRKIENPLYTAVDPKDKILIREFHEVLKDYVVLMRNLHGQGKSMTQTEKNTALNKYAMKLSDFYLQVFQGQSPLHLKIGDFLAKYPEFGSFIESTVKKPGSTLFSDLKAVAHKSLDEVMRVEQGAIKLFDQHHCNPDAIAKKRTLEVEYEAGKNQRSGH